MTWSAIQSSTRKPVYSTVLKITLQDFHSKIALKVTNIFRK